MSGLLGPVDMPLPCHGQAGGFLSRRDARRQQHAKGLRTESTDTEQLLWSKLRRRQVLGHKFRRQQVLGHFIVDFACLEKKLVIELDGGQHAEQQPYDERRSRWLEQHGFRVLRFWDHQVFQELDAILQAIAKALEVAPLPASPTPHD
jgi:very-short-patch-repair endonuclease